MSCRKTKPVSEFDGRATCNVCRPLKKLQMAEHRERKKEALKRQGEEAAALSAAVAPRKRQARTDTLRNRSGGEAAVATPASMRGGGVKQEPGVEGAFPATPFECRSFPLFGAVVAPVARDPALLQELQDAIAFQADFRARSVPSSAPENSSWTREYTPPDGFPAANDSLASAQHQPNYSSALQQLMVAIESQNSQLRQRAPAQQGQLSGGSEDLRAAVDDILHALFDEQQSAPPPHHDLAQAEQAVSRTQTDLSSLPQFGKATGGIVHCLGICSPDDFKDAKSLFLEAASRPEESKSFSLVFGFEVHTPSVVAFT